MREWLYKMRKERGLTMKNMGEAIGFTESYYCAIENGDRQKRMDAALIIGIANALGCEPALVLENEKKYMEAGME